jgi:hypothetical protein
MTQPTKTFPQGPVKPIETRQFKYPSEDEALVRRLGSAALTLWASLPPEVQQKILAEANLVWDREYNIPGLPAKLEAFVKRRGGR